MPGPMQDRQDPIFIAEQPDYKVGRTEKPVDDDPEGKKRLSRMLDEMSRKVKENMNTEMKTRIAEKDFVKSLNDMSTENMDRETAQMMIAFVDETLAELNRECRGKTLHEGHPLYRQFHSLKALGQRLRQISQYRVTEDDPMAIDNPVIGKRASFPPHDVVRVRNEKEQMRYLREKREEAIENGVGWKDDQEKYEFSYMPMIWLDWLYEPAAEGREKYADDNWKTLDPDRLVDSTFRHCKKHIEGRQNGVLIPLDEDNHNLAHLKKVATTALMALWILTELERNEDKNRIANDMIESKVLK